MWEQYLIFNINKIKLFNTIRQNKVSGGTSPQCIVHRSVPAYSLHLQRVTHLQKKKRVTNWMWLSIFNVSLINFFRLYPLINTTCIALDSISSTLHLWQWWIHHYLIRLICSFLSFIVFFFLLKTCEMNKCAILIHSRTEGVFIWQYVCDTLLCLFFVTLFLAPSTCFLPCLFL